MSRPIAILTHEGYPQRAGIAVYTREMALAAARLGHRVTLFTPARPGLDPADFPGVRLRPLPLKGNHNWPDRTCLARGVRAWLHEHPDATVHLAEPGPLRTWMYADLLRLPWPERLAITLYGTELTRLVTLPHRRRLASRVLRRAWRIGVISRFVEQTLARTFPEVAGRALLTPAGLRTDLPYPEVISPRPDHTPVTLLTVGRVQPRKGQRHVVDALARLEPAERQRFVYRIVGQRRDPAYAAGIEKAARKANLILRWEDGLDDVGLADAYRTADLAVLAAEDCPRSVEGQGMFPLEARAFGLPILATRAGGIPEQVPPAALEDLLPPTDTEALATALRRGLDVSWRQAWQARQQPPPVATAVWDASAAALYG